MCPVDVEGEGGDIDEEQQQQGQDDEGQDQGGQQPPRGGLQHTAHIIVSLDPEHVVKVQVDILAQPLQHLL